MPGREGDLVVIAVDETCANRARLAGLVPI